MSHRFLFTVVLFGSLAGCATEALNRRGHMVEMVQTMERKDCRNLGPVFGKGGGAFGGGWISDEQLMEYAANDLRNKAGARGATHVVFSSHQMGNTSGQHGGTTSTATFTGIAYWCPPYAEPPPQVVAAPAASQPNPPAGTAVTATATATETAPPQPSMPAPPSEAAPPAPAPQSTPPSR